MWIIVVLSGTNLEQEHLFKSSSTWFSAFNRQGMSIPKDGVGKWGKSCSHLTISGPTIRPTNQPTSSLTHSVDPWHMNEWRALARNCAINNSSETLEISAHWRRHPNIWNPVGPIEFKWGHVEFWKTALPRVMWWWFGQKKRVFCLEKTVFRVEVQR